MSDASDITFSHGDQALISAYEILVAARRAALSAQLAAIFATNARFVWEIGCGHGHFLTAYAAEHPGQICIGIDIAGDRIERANRKRERAKLRNLHFIRADARLFLEAIPAGVHVERVLILFPDPWPKLRHHKHRIFQPDFLSAIARRLGEGGRLYFRTDHEPYFNAAAAVLATHPAWSAASDEPWCFEHESVFQQRAANYRSLIARRRDPSSPAR